MKLNLFAIGFIFLIAYGHPADAQDFQKDIIETIGGDLVITFIGHGTLMFEFQEKVIHVDPWTQLADYSKLPKADVILITHDHGDHLDPVAIEQASKETTELLLPAICLKKLNKGKLVKNGDYMGAGGFPIEAVPAYNTLAKRGNGIPYHRKGDGYGYIITFGSYRVYVAGDTEYFPEMEQMKMINIAFLPMNLPYTMAPTLVAICARVINPQILYPYHYGDTKPEELVKLLFGTDIDVRIRPMK